MQVKAPLPAAAMIRTKPNTRGSKMSYRTVLVCLNEVDRAAVLLQLSGDLAKAQDAHLIGLFVIPGLRIYPANGMAMTPELFEVHREMFTDRAEAAKALFEARVRDVDLPAEWRLVESGSPLVADTVIQHARQADLVVASQSSHESGSGVESDFAGRIAMESGRPVLLVPHYGRFEHCGRRALIGWNGTREAARAAFDAVGILKHAHSVHVSWIDSQESQEDASPNPAAELAKTLARHGIKMTAERLARSEIGAGEALLSHASDLGADLIVMGAYGHSRLREFILGGATRTILQSMTVPVLMSH
jgi:nucleotide-binding universal stress UspA family protein